MRRITPLFVMLVSHVAPPVQRWSVKPVVLRMKRRCFQRRRSEACEPEIIVGRRSHPLNCPGALMLMGGERWTPQKQRASSSHGRLPPGGSALTCQLPAPARGVVVRGKFKRNHGDVMTVPLGGSAASGIEKGKRLEGFLDLVGSQTPEKKIEVAVIISPTRSERCGAPVRPCPGSISGPGRHAGPHTHPRGVFAIAGLEPLHCLTNCQQACSSALNGPQRGRIPEQ